MEWTDHQHGEAWKGAICAIDTSREDWTQVQVMRTFTGATLVILYAGGFEVARSEAPDGLTPDQAKAFALEWVWHLLGVDTGKLRVPSFPGVDVARARLWRHKYPKSPRGPKPLLERRGS